MHRSYWKILIAIILGGFVLNAAADLLIDPYRVFGLLDFNRKNFEVNSRFLKTGYLDAHRDYETIVFGTSRAEAYDPATLDALTGGRSYNFWVPGESMEGVRQKIAWLVQEGYPLERAVICLDYDFMFVLEDIEPFDLLRQEHYAVSGESPLKFYSRYLVFQPRVLRKTITANRAAARVKYRFDTTTGRDVFPGRSRAGGAQSGDVSLPRIGTRARPERLQSFHATLALLAAHDIEAVCIVNPVNQRLMLSYDMQDYVEWLHGLVQQGAVVWDFSGFNAITSDDSCYTDLSHFSLQTGDRLLERIFGRPASEFKLQSDTVAQRSGALLARYRELTGQPKPGEG